MGRLRRKFGSKFAGRRRLTSPPSPRFWWWWMQRDQVWLQTSEPITPPATQGSNLRPAIHVPTVQPASYLPALGYWDDKALWSDNAYWRD